MSVVSFSIFKGGTGKTTTAVSAASALVQKKKSVLLIDLDQQASATRYLDIDPDQSQSLHDVFTRGVPLSNIIQKSALGIDVVPSNVYMAILENMLEPGEEQKLAAAIAPLK